MPSSLKGPSSRLTSGHRKEPSFEAEPLGGAGDMKHVYCCTACVQVGAPFQGGSVFRASAVLLCILPITFRKTFTLEVPGTRPSCCGFWSLVTWT